MTKYYLIGIIFLTWVFSISEGRSEIALTQEQEQKAAKINSLIEFYYEQGIFSGTVLVAEAGKVIYQKGFGYANVDTKERLEPKSVFRLASLSKQFTAMCIMILEEQGKLNYDDNLQDLRLAAMEAVAGFARKEDKEFEDFWGTDGFNKYIKTSLMHN